jgi:hypothetical protein
MPQKQPHRSATGSGGRGATGSRASRGGAAVWRRLVYRAALGRTSEGTTPGSRRLDGPIACAQADGTHCFGCRAVDLAVAASVEGKERFGRVRGCCHWTRTGSPRRPVSALDPDDRPYPPTLRGLGRSPSYAASATAARMVSSRGRRRPGRVGQLRHHRGSGDPRRTGCHGFDGSFAAWRVDGGVDSPGRQRQNGGRALGGTLAGRRPSRLRSVRQRQPFSRTATARRHGGTRDAVVSGPGDRACICAAQRNRFSGGHRKLQRPLAGEGLVAIRASFALRTGRPFRPLHRRLATASRDTHRSSAGPPSLSETLASRSSKTPRGNDHLFATHRQPGPRQRAWTYVYSRSELASPPDPRRCRSGSGNHPFLRPATTRSKQPAPPERSRIRTPQKTISGVTLIL